MKRNSKILMAILLIYSLYADANGDLDYTSCYQYFDSSCDVVLKNGEKINENTYDVELIDAKNGRKVFPYSERNEVMESVTFGKYNKTYLFSKEYLDNTKAIESISYKYESNKPFLVKYFYIESSIDFYSNTKQWSGKICTTSTGEMPKKEGGSLLQAGAMLCVNKIKLPHDSNEIRGQDVLFNLSKVVNGEIKDKMTLIALDSKGSDVINVSDLGCVRNCEVVSDMVNYIGKINEKIRIKLYLKFDDDIASGFYYYDKIKKKINVSGYRDGNRITLSAKMPEGDELFKGVLDEGQYKGIWFSATRDKEYPFSLYMAFIQ